MKSIFILLLLSFSFSHADPPNPTPEPTRAPTPVTAAQLNAIKAAMLADINHAGFVRTLSRPIKVYRWITASQEMRAAKLKPDDPFWESEAKDLAVTWFNLGRHVGQFGNGYYAAPNPIVSRHYGDTVREITIPAGTKYYDVRDADNFLFTQETIDLYLASCNQGRIYRRNSVGWNLNNKVYKRLLRAIIYRPDTNPNGERCARMFNQLITELKVEFFSYDWIGTSANPPQCTTTTASSSAFVLVGKLNRTDSAYGLSVSFNQPDTPPEKKWIFRGYMVEDAAPDFNQEETDQAFIVDRFYRLYDAHVVPDADDDEDEVTYKKWIYSFFDPEVLSRTRPRANAKLRPSESVVNDIENILSTRLQDFTFGCNPSIHEEDARLGMVHVNLQ